MTVFKFVYVILGSILFISAGYVFVFKQDWLWEITEKSAKKQGRKVKRTKQWNLVRTVVGWLGILFGLFGIVVMLCGLSIYIPLM